MTDKIDPTAASEFLQLESLALVGASDDKKQFSNAVFRELDRHGVHAIPVNPGEATVGGRTCYPSVTAVPERLDGVIVMVNKQTAVQVVKDCIDRGVTHVWLFKGLGGDGAMSDEAVALCRAHGIELIPGACPMMFLEPVQGFHRFHRGMRRVRGAIRPAA